LHELRGISIPLIPEILRPQSLSDHQRARAPIAPRTTAKMPVGAMLDPALGAEEDAAAPDPDSDADATACETLERAPPTAEEAEARLVERPPAAEEADPPMVTPAVAEVKEAETPEARDDAEAEALSEELSWPQASSS